LRTVCGRPLLGLVAAVVVASAGCGSSSAPSLPSDVALPLARQSDAVARALDRGDSCVAAKLAATLRRKADAAVISGRVPSRFTEELRLRTSRLAAAIVCTPAPPLPPPPPPPPPPALLPPPPSAHEGKEPGKGHGRGHQKSKEKHSGKGKRD
jgi:hypothetical protein